MKLSQLLTSLLAFACVAVTVSAQTGTAASGIVVKAVSPRAWATGPDGKQIKLKAGMTLPEGSRITTGGSGSVDVFLGNAAAAFQVTASSDLTIQKASPATPTAAAVPAEVKITVKAGGLVGNTTGMKAETKFSVTTPKGELTVKPAEFALTANGSVVVKSGTVQVQTATVQNGQTTTKTTTVAANQEFTPGTSPTGPGPAVEAKVQPTSPEVKAALESKFVEVAKVETASTGTQGNQNPSQTPPSTPTVQPITTPGSGNGTGANLTTELDKIAQQNSNK